MEEVMEVVYVKPNIIKRFVRWCKDFRYNRRLKKLHKVIDSFASESNSLKHAANEFNAAGWLDKNGKFKDEMQGYICKDIARLLILFSTQGHSGSTAHYTMGLFKKLVDFKPIVPLTFEDDEWNEVGEDTYQNRRNSAVFKEGKSGRPYYIDAYVMVTTFEDGHTSSWGGSLKMKYGKRVYRCYLKPDTDTLNLPTISIPMDVESTGDDPSDWDFVPAAYEDLVELQEHYDVDFTKD